MPIQTIFVENVKLINNSRKRDILGLYVASNVFMIYPNTHFLCSQHSLHSKLITRLFYCFEVGVAYRSEYFFHKTGAYSNGTMC